MSNPGSDCKFEISGVYGEPSHNLRDALWDSIVSLSNYPRLLIGDFNAYLEPTDKYGGAEPHWASINKFRRCLDEARLSPIDFIGERYTWSNGSTSERIDWALGNIEWNLKFESTKVQHLMKFGSDHRPLWFCSTQSNPLHSKSNLFRYHAAWSLEESFERIIEQAWNKIKRSGLNSQSDLEFRKKP